MQPTTTEWAGWPYLDVLGRRVEQLLAVLQCKARRWVNEYHPAPPKNEKRKKRNVKTHLKVLFDRAELPVDLLQLFPLQRNAPVLGRAGQGPAAAADYKQTKPQKLHVGVSKVWGGRSPEAFSYRKIYWKCTLWCHSPFYTYPGGDRKTTRRELEICRNWRVWLTKFLFHCQSPLRDPRVASRFCACVGPLACVWT